jgi:hypothetical protein
MFSSFFFFSLSLSLSLSLAFFAESDGNFGSPAYLAPKNLSFALHGLISHVIKWFYDMTNSFCLPR